MELATMEQGICKDIFTGAVGVKEAQYIRKHATREGYGRVCAQKGKKEPRTVPKYNFQGCDLLGAKCWPNKLHTTPSLTIHSGKGLEGADYMHRKKWRPERTI